MLVQRYSPTGMVMEREVLPELGELFIDASQQSAEDGLWIYAGMSHGGWVRVSELVANPLMAHPVIAAKARIYLREIDAIKRETA